MNTQADDDARAAAERFIVRFGDTAPDEALRRAKELVDAGHDDAARTWERIAEMARGLLAQSPGDADWRH